MRIAITGSNGFIGSELTRHFLSEGHEVLLLQRRAPEMLSPGAQFIPYDLNDAPRLPELPSFDALIHTAFIPFSKSNSSSSQKNIEGTMALYQYCLAHHIQFVFLSSLSAHEQALSQYGKHKFELEQKLDAAHCLILKLGLVVGQSGLFHRIQSSLKKSPFIFLVGGGHQPLQPVSVQEVVNVIAQSIREKRNGRFLLASPRAYSLKEICSIIAAQANRKPVFIPVPYWLAEWGIRLVETLHLPFPVSNENLLGLKQLRAFDTKADLKQLGVHIGPLEAKIR